MYGPISLDSKEILICLFLRGDGEAFDKIAPRDFERRMHLKPPEGGISFYRAETTDYKFIVNKVTRTPLLNRGVSTISVGELEEIGFKVCGELATNDQHVQVHCLDCNCTARDCRPDGNTCSFISPESANAENDRMRRLLADAMFVVIEARNSRTDLLEIFGKDFKGTFAEMNAEYARRWELSQHKASQESTSR